MGVRFFIAFLGEGFHHRRHPKLLVYPMQNGRCEGQKRTKSNFFLKKFNFFPQISCTVFFFALYLHSQNEQNGLHRSKLIAEIAQLVEHNLAKVGVASSSLVFRSKSKSFEDKIKQNPLKHRFRGFFICCRSVSLRLQGAPTRHSPNLEVSLRISTVKLRDTYSEIRGHFGLLGKKSLTISKLLN